MGRINRFLLDHGVYTMVRWWNVMTNPPLLHHRGAARRGLRVIDEALEIADEAMED